jgi:uncharacterized protein YidB (DUF937 family)
MGLLDNLAGSLFGGNAGNTGASSPLLKSVVDMLGSNQGGGLGGLVQAFQQNGLGHLMESWIGTGQNLPVSAGQIQQALGPKVQELAQQHGLSADAVSQALSQFLPGLIDHLTPNGQLPQGGVGAGLSALRSKLGI